MNRDIKKHCAKNISHRCDDYKRYSIESGETQMNVYKPFDAFNEDDRMVKNTYTKVLETLRKGTNRLQILEELIQKDVADHALVIEEYDEHPLNKTKGEEWINKLKMKLNEEDRKFNKIIRIAKKLLCNTTHISFGEFLSALANCLNDFLESIPENENYIILMHTANTGEVKSNEWIAKIIIYVIMNEDRKLPKDILFSASQAFELYPDFGKDEVAHFLIFDDMAYSGSQLISTLNGMIQELCVTFYGTNKAGRIVQDRSDSDMRFNTKIHVIVPYLSSIAQDKMNENQGLCNFVSIHNDSIFKPFVAYLTDDEKAIYNDYFIKEITVPQGQFSVMKTRGSDELIPVYFDHKIADWKSTFSTIYNTGLIPHEEEIRFTKDVDLAASLNFFQSFLQPFIENCDYDTLVTYWKAKNIPHDFLLNLYQKQFVEADLNKADALEEFYKEMYHNEFVYLEEITEQEKSELEKYYKKQIKENLAILTEMKDNNKLYTFTLFPKFQLGAILKTIECFVPFYKKYKTNRNYPFV